MSGVSITNLTRRTSAPRALFIKVAGELLPGWDISLVFVTPARARTLNKKLRSKEYVPNVLSYVVGKKSAEIIICLAEAKAQAPEYGLTVSDFILKLFIHGALHIKGWPHGARMERCEQTLVARYGTAHSNRHRHRDVPGKDGRRRRGLR